ncbi:MAG: hypothetical protein M5U01_01245 [Ardenticatenaceae bacterium]|nr:hypothetical protein [Ardenticatenaceae bacterium]
MRLFEVILLVLVIASASQRVGMADPGGLDIQHLARAEGLRSNGVTALAVEDEGLLIGSLAGLDRLEDARISPVQVPLPEAAVTALLVDGGTLWVGTTKGLARRDRDGNWHAWSRGEAGLASADVTGLAPGGLVGTYGGGVLRWQREAGDRAQAHFVMLGTEGPVWVTALAGDETDAWAGSASEGLWHWDGTRWVHLSPPGEGAARVTALLVETERLAGVRNSKRKTQDSSIVWVGTRSGLWRFEPGRGWSPTGITTPVTALGRDASSRLVASGRTLYHSDDGRNWTVLVTDLPGVITAMLADSGGRWIGLLGGGLERVGVPVEVQAPRLPVILVHGYTDAPDVYRSQFHFLARWLRQDGWPVFYAADLTPDAPLLDNAARLARTIAQARADTGADRVLLIAHSLGGLTARVYLGSDLYHNDVAGLVTLGTPHAGVRLVYDFLARDLANGDGRPATAELLPEHMALLERFLAEREVPILAIGGDRLPDGVLLAGLPPSDGLITAASAVAVPDATTTIQPLAHGWSPTLLALQVESYLFPERLYEQTIRPWLVQQASREAGEPGSGRVRPSAPPLLRASALPPPGQTREPLARRSVDPHEAITVPFTADADETVHLFLTWDRGLLAFDLLGPDGARYEHDRPAPSDDAKHLELTEGELRPLSLWSVQAPAAGRWQAVITNIGTVPAEMWLDTVRPGRPELTLSLARPAMGERAAQLTVVETPGRGEGEIHALVARLAGTATPLQPAGARRAQATLSLPAPPGYYPVEVSGAGQTRWTILTRPDDTAIPEVAVRPQADGGATITAVVESPIPGRYALGLEVWASRANVPSPAPSPSVRRLSPPQFVVPGSPARVVWQLGPDDLPTGTARIVARVTALNANGPLVPGRDAENHP